MNQEGLSAGKGQVLIEELEAIGKGEEGADGDGGHHVRDGDPPKGLPAAGAIDLGRLQHIIRDSLQAGDINNHHIADLLPAHEDHKAPEAVLRLQKNGGIITGENTVKDHGPHIAQHDAADEVGHEEHRAEQAAALNALGEGIGHGEGQYIDENQRHQCEQARIPEGMHKAGILQCLDIVPQADELRVRSRLKLAEGQVYTFTERIDKSDNKSADHGPHKKWEPAPKRAADQRPADRCRAFLALQIDHSHQKIDCCTAQTSCGPCRDRTGEAGEGPPLLAYFRVSGFDPN